MKQYENPIRSTWQALLQRPQMDREQLELQVSEIIATVKRDGDEALQYYSRIFDPKPITQFKVGQSEITSQAAKVTANLKRAIDQAAININTFHKSQQLATKEIETAPGVRCWRKALPIEKVGLYVPGGSAPLFSSFLMLAVPARLAGCEKVVVCTPPNPHGTIEPAIAYIAQKFGIDQLFKVGGAQAIAAMTFGTNSIPAVDKVLGPGNQYVTAAKQLLQREGLAIDMPAGPSEVLVIADKSAKASFVAADLLSQAEHGPDSQVILCTSSKSLAQSVAKEVAVQLQSLARKSTAQKSLENSKIFILPDLETCFELSNCYAPEHLIIATEENEADANRVKNAGSVFLGNYSCETAGDYASGTNHTLPTNGYARGFSGVSLDSFTKNVTFQKLSEQGLRNLENTLLTLSRAEGLEAHARAVSIRLKSNS